MNDEETVLSIPIETENADKVFTILQNIDATLLSITKDSKNVFSSFDKTDKPLNKTDKAIKKANKSLKDTDKTLGGIAKKIKLTNLLSMGVGAIAKGAGLLGVSTGALLFGALKNTGQNIKQEYTAKDLGLNVSELKALEVSSEKITGEKSAFTQAATSMVKALNDVSKSGAFGTLGLDQAALKKLSPTKALETVLNAVKDRPQDITGQVYRQAFNDITGGGVAYNVATKEGAGDLAKYFSEYMAKYSGVNFKEIQEASRALIDFKAQLDLSSQLIGGKLAEPLTKFAEKATPAIERLTDTFTTFLDSITEEQINKFIDNTIKIFNFIGKIAGGTFEIGGALFSNEKPDIKKVQKEQKEAIKKGDIGGLVKTSLKSGATQIGNVFSKEGRKENELIGIENMVINSIQSGDTEKELLSYGPKIKSAAESLGYISPDTGLYTEKAKEIQGKKSVSQVAAEKTGSAIKGLASWAFGKITGKENENKDLTEEAPKINTSDFTKTSNTNNNTENTKNNNTTIHQVNINVNSQKEAIDTFNDLSKDINVQTNKYYLGTRSR